ncbi:MAG: Ku protein [Granulicella sp.]
MARPYWSGQLRISLVSFGIRLFPATEAKSEIHFHQLNRKTGERIKYQKTSGDQSEEQGPVQASEIVKGYEYSKGEYVMIEPHDIENLRIPSKKTLDITQFVDIDAIEPEFFEKPYFVVPETDAHAEAFAVVRKALQATKKVALGKIAFGGREHLVAISAGSDDALPGMMAYTMRYAEELRKPADYFGEIKKVAIDADQLALAKELIERKAAKFAPEKFKDEYESALRAMVEAKVKHAPLPKEESAPRSAKVVSLMDALRRSVKGDEAPAPKKTATRTAEGKSGPTLVKSSPAKSAKHAKSRKSA